LFVASVWDCGDGDRDLNDVDARVVRLVRIASSAPSSITSFVTTCTEPVSSTSSTSEFASRVAVPRLVRDVDRVVGIPLALDAERFRAARARD
jgi:hypothetical protein